MYKLTEELSAVFNVDLPCRRQPNSNFESYNDERCWLIKEYGCPQQQRQKKMEKAYSFSGSFNESIFC